MVGGSRERIAFASSAIELIHAASNGVPRLVNIISDRALTRGYIERVSVIGAAVVAGAIDELQMVSGQVSMSGQVIDTVPYKAPVEPELVVPAPEPIAVAAPPVTAPTPPVAVAR